jgi:hypothetical protein
VPIPSCPPAISRMMTARVKWESFQGFDGHGEPTYAPAQILSCYREAHGMMQGGLEAIRKADETTADPDWDLFFSGDDVKAEQFTLWDRLTQINAVGDPVGFPEQPSSINTLIGPPFDNANPWLIVVST